MGHVGPTLNKIKKIKLVSDKDEEGEGSRFLFLFLFFHSLLSSIYGVSTVGIRRAKNESSSTRRGLRVRPKNKGFRRDFN